MPDLGQKCTRANFAGQDLGHRSARLGRLGRECLSYVEKENGRKIPENTCSRSNPNL